MEICEVCGAIKNINRVFCPFCGYHYYDDSYKLTQHQKDVILKRDDNAEITEEEYREWSKLKKHFITVNRVNCILIDITKLEKKYEQQLKKIYGIEMALENILDANLANRIMESLEKLKENAKKIAEVIIDLSYMRVFLDLESLSLYVNKESILVEAQSCLIERDSFIDEISKSMIRSFNDFDINEAINKNIQFYKRIKENVSIKMAGTYLSSSSPIPITKNETTYNRYIEISRDIPNILYELDRLDAETDLIE
jgi:hypothetical protein